MPTWRPAIPTRPSTRRTAPSAQAGLKKRAPARAKPRNSTARKASAGRGRAAEGAKRPATKRTRAPRPLAEQPLGAGVADAFAVRRLNIPSGSRGRPRSGVREIGWAEFGQMALELAERIRGDFVPDVVLGIANPGIIVAGAVAPALEAEVVHLHLPGRGAMREKLPSLAGKKALVVDDVTSSGDTLARAVKAAKRAKATEVQTAVLVVKRPGKASPDWFAVETDEVIIFGWDYRSPGSDSSDPGETGV